MNIELKEITIAQLHNGYKNDDSTGSVVGYNGNLDIRPPYQREFVYSPEQQQMVIDTVYQGFPLNVMYWASRDDGTWEVLDGQQRTLSICEYLEGNFSVKIGDDMLGFKNLQDDQRNKILNYKLSVYVCTGEASEKLKWFKRINIAGEVLTDQEILNAVYHGEFVTAAKKFFSRNNCPAYAIGKDYVTGVPKRQDYLERAIEWISAGNVEKYMSDNQHRAETAEELWTYYKNVISWIKDTINPSEARKKIMKGIDWGSLYNSYHDNKYDTAAIEAEVKKLMLDDDVTNKRGIYPYYFTRKPKYLSLRAFSDAIKLATYERQNGKCAKCGKDCKLDDMDADHITPWIEGGHTTPDNCQMLCKECNRSKGKK